MSWLFSQVLVEEYSVGIYSDGEPCAQLNVMPTPHKFWRNDKTIECSRLSQFGLTLQLLTADLGAALLTSFLVDSRAKGLAQRVKGQDSATLEADYGNKCGALFAKYSQAESMWKTVQCSLLADSIEYSGTWPRWGSMRNGECWGRTMPGLPTPANASGLLPTPTASNTKAHHMRGADKGKVREPRSYGTHGPLNPRFLEWHMGWPVGWTKLEPLAMAKYQEWQQQHGSY